MRNFDFLTKTTGLPFRDTKTGKPLSIYYKYVDPIKSKGYMPELFSCCLNAVSKFIVYLTEIVEYIEEKESNGMEWK